MSDHIKTGDEIYLLRDIAFMEDDDGEAIDSFKKSKWVSLSWLKEQVKKKKEDISKDDRCYCPECGAVIGCYAHFCTKCNTRVASPLEVNPDGSDSGLHALEWVLSVVEG